jgi:hypothetical protein
MSEKELLEGMRLEVAPTALGLEQPELRCPHCHRPVKLVLPGAKENDASSKPAWRAKARS